MNDMLPEVKAINNLFSSLKQKHIVQNYSCIHKLI